MLWERLLSLVASNEILHKINKLLLTSCSDGVLIQNCSREILKFVHDEHGCIQPLDRFQFAMVSNRVWVSCAQSRKLSRLHIWSSLAVGISSIKLANTCIGFVVFIMAKVVFAPNENVECVWTFVCECMCIEHWHKWAWFTIFTIYKVYLFCLYVIRILSELWSMISV